MNPTPDTRLANKKAGHLQLSSFEVQGLFGRYNHKIYFPIAEGGEPKPSLVILHGPNGIGKTTILRMLDGMLQLDFTVFRQIPCTKATLTFSSNQSITVDRVITNKRYTALCISFAGRSVLLHPSHSGPKHEKDSPAVEEFRRIFFQERSTITFEFIDTSRILRRQAIESHEDLVDDEFFSQDGFLYKAPRPHFLRNRSTEKRNGKSLAERVARFISEAQVNHRRFFAAGETNVFADILRSITEQKEVRLESAPLFHRLKSVSEEEKRFKHFGIETDDWDIRNIESLLKKAEKSTREHALVALRALVEVIESRAAERRLLADRLETFVRVVSEFFHDKDVCISERSGLEIKTRGNPSKTLSEQQLSTGEYHLLYLMVAALETQRRGTVIAIDEPEMSMHLAWQRKLVRGLVECASKAEPQFIFATHSPDIAADFPEALVALPPEP